MHRLRVACARQAGIVRRYPLAATLVLASFARVLWVGYRMHQMPHAVGYLAAVWVSTLALDFLVTDGGEEFPIRQPVWHELPLIVGCTALGFVALLIRYSGYWHDLMGLARLGCFGIMLLFMFPLALAGVYLLVWRYRPRELGVRLQGWSVAPVVLGIFGGMTSVVARHGNMWSKLFHAWGLWWMLWIGLVEAALSEEFTRMLLQTRLALAFRNRGLGFVAATVIWACLHMPRFRAESFGAWTGAFFGAVTIMPVGFLWGYLTYRTKSLLPAVLVHGLNYWGLQNFIG